MGNRARGVEDLQSPSLPAPSTTQQQSYTTTTTGLTPPAPAFGENLEAFEEACVLHVLNNPSQTFAHADEMLVNTGSEDFDDALSSMSF